MIIADIINIVVQVLLKFLAEWLTQLLLSLFGIGSTQE